MIHCYTIITFVQLGNAITPSVSRCFNCVFGLLRGKFHSIFVSFEADFYAVSADYHRNRRELGLLQQLAEPPRTTSKAVIGPPIPISQ